MPDNEKKVKPIGGGADHRKSMTRRPDKTVIKSLGQCSFTRNGAPAAIDVKDGMILRIRPLHFLSEYRKDEIKPWKINKN